jgi:hypothetical protein
MVQAAPAGHFQAYNACCFRSHSRWHSQRLEGELFRALDVHGNPVWSFVNSVGQGGDGAALGIISGGAAIDYLNNRAYFASRPIRPEAPIRSGASRLL